MASIVSAGTTSATALNMSADTSGVLQLASNNGTVAVTVDTSQNIGVFTTPSVWSSQFKAIQFGNAKYGTISQRNNSTSEFNLGWNVYNNSTGTSGSNGYVGINTGDVCSLYMIGGANHTWLVSNTAATAGSAVSWTASMAFNPTGYLSIANAGTSGSGAVNALTLNNPGTTVGDGPKLLFLSGTSTTGGCAIAGYGTSLNAADMVFYAGGNTERMRITASGQLTAGNSGTGYGSITGGNISGFDPVATNAYQKAAITATGAYGGGLCVLDGTYGWVMYGLTNGADFYIRRGSSGTALSGGVYLSNGATSWSAASDERLKNIKRPITNALEKLKDYRCVIGEYKDNLGVERPFLIAQDVRATFPEAVNVMDKDEGYLGMSYADMIPLLTKSIQELSAKVTALENK